MATCKKCGDEYEVTDAFGEDNDIVSKVKNTELDFCPVCRYLIQTRKRVVNHERKK